MDLELRERVALITGSSRGIGRAVALQFALEGARVAITYWRERQKAEDLVKQITGSGGEAIALFLDLALLDSVSRAVQSVVEHWGRLDVLVNNAVSWGPRRYADAPAFEDLPPDEWESLLNANISGVFRITQLVIPPMRKQAWGRIVNVSSIVAEDGLLRGAWYATAKSSLHGLTRTLSKELGPHGILINTVMPGLTDTDRVAGLASEARQRVEQRSSIRRMLQPDDVASAIVFLSSCKNSAITGEILRLGGDRA